LARETHFSAKQARPQAPAWIPCPHGDRRWPQDFGPAPGQGPQAPVRLKYAVSPRIVRLKQRSEFLLVAGARQKWAAPSLVLQARKTEGGLSAKEPKVRVGFTVSRKVGNAVARNRARRRLRAAAERVMPLHAKVGHDFVLIGRAATLKRPFVALVADLETALRRLGAYHETEGGEDCPEPKE